jgi:hypothetical protein
MRLGASRYPPVCVSNDVIAQTGANGAAAYELHVDFTADLLKTPQEKNRSV